MPDTTQMNSDCITAFHSLLETFQSPTVLISPDYRILAANRHYTQQHGADESVGGNYCYSVSHHYDRPCHEMGELCPMQVSRETGKAQRVLHLHHTPHGEEHVDVELCPLNDANGEISAFIEVMHPIKSARDEDNGRKLIGRSPSFTRAMELISRVAPSDATVMLHGESGTGKELAALAVHRASNRADGPFVPVECSGLSESLFESELFGHEKGAFTGAHSQKQGLVESARGGTLFLDEIGDVPLNLQVKLLRLLETGTYRRVGGVEALQAEFRLVCATHCNLEKMVKEGKFRQDLFFRINVFPITLPALRERQEDLPLLITSLLDRLAPGRELVMSEKALTCLEHYAFPGNIRELRNLLERAILLADGNCLEPEHFPVICNADARETDEGPRFSGLLPLDELEQRYLDWAMATYPGDKGWLAAQLGVSERTLYRKLEKVNIEGTLLTLGEISKHMIAQAIGGDIVVISTKNVPCPGAGFGAYSATKAACHQLGRIASIELAEYGIRVNMVAPDAVFSEGTYRSGLWEEVGPGRMKARGLNEQELHEYYRNRNLLRSKVTGKHVANAVLFFVTRQTPTTGVTIPVDGGLPDATPR